MVYDSKRDRLLLFGGYGTAVYDDLWAWAPTTREWTQISVTGTRPTARYGHWMFYDAVRDKVLRLRPEPRQLPDLGVRSGAQQLDGSHGHLAAGGRVAQLLRRRVRLDRGKIVDDRRQLRRRYTTDIWEWDTTTGVWAQAVPATGSTVPDGRYYHTIAYDSIRRVVADGRRTRLHHRQEHAGINDSWEWDPNLRRSGPRRRRSGVKPLPREKHLMTFNSLAGTTYLFGGSVPERHRLRPVGVLGVPAERDATRRTAPAARRRRPTSCKSGNCVDGVCCAQTAAECNGTCRSCNVAGKAGTCDNVPAGQPDDTCPSDQACDATQQCKTLLGHTCTSFTECASGNCTDGVCCDTACNGTCQQCNLAGKRGTCSPAGERHRGSADLRVRSDQPRACDGTGTCTRGKQASGKPCTAGGQCTSGYCIDGFCCNSTCAPTCYPCDQADGGRHLLGASRPARRITARPRRATADAVLQRRRDRAARATRSRTADCARRGLRLRQRLLRRRRLLQHRLHSAPASRAPCRGSVGTCVQRPARRAGHERDDALRRPGSTATPPASASRAPSRTAPPAPAAADCGSNFCVDGVCCNSACTDTCYACNVVGQRQVHGRPSGGTDANAADEACAAPNYCTKPHDCTIGQEAERRDLHAATSSAARTSASTAPAARARARARQVPELQERDGHLHVRRGRHGPAQGLRRARAGLRRDLQRPGRLPLGPQGTTCRRPAARRPRPIIDGAVRATAPATAASRRRTSRTAAASAATRIRRRGPVQDRLQDAIPTARSTLLRRRGRDGGRRRRPASSCPAAFDLGHACTRNTQCLCGTCAIRCAIGVCCNINCDKCGTCNSRHEGTCIPDRGRHRSRDASARTARAIRRASAAGSATATRAAPYPAAGTACGTCKACNGVGLCNTKRRGRRRVRDRSTATASNTTCMDYHDLTTNRCGALGVCKTPNTRASCTIFTNSCTPDGGAGGGSAARRGGGGGVGRRERYGRHGAAATADGGDGRRHGQGGGAAAAAATSAVRTPRARAPAVRLGLCSPGAGGASLLSKNDGTHDATIDRRHGGAAGPGDLPEGMEVGEYRVLTQDRRGRDGVRLRRRSSPSSASASRSRCWRRTSPPTRSWCAASSTRRAPSTRSATRTSSTSSRSAGCPTGATTSRWSSSTARAWPIGSRGGRSSPTRRGASCARSARRWRRRTARGSSTAISSPTTSGSSQPQHGDSYAKLLDFGIAKLMGDDDEGQPHADRHRHGHAGVHVARAVPRRERRSRHGHLRARDDPLRDVRGPAAVRRRASPS